MISRLFWVRTTRTSPAPDFPGTDLTIGIENGPPKWWTSPAWWVQTTKTISTDGTAGNLSIEDGNTIALNVDDADADPTNEYNTGISFDGANLTVTDAGGNQSVDISGVSTDDQNLNLAANTLSIEDGNSVDLSPYLDDTDDQNISGSGLSGTDLTIGIENGASEVVDLSSLVGTDDQNISGSGLSGTDLTIGIENGASEVVDLSSLVGTDDQNLNLAANTLSIEDGNSVDLSPYLDNTDDQNISGSGLSGTDLTIGIENGASEVVDLSSLVGTDDQNISTDGTAGNLSIEDGNTIALNVDDADADPTNEYNTGISFDGANLTVTDAGGNQSVDISGVSTDDQNISGSGLSGTDLTIGIENGTSEVVDLSSLVGTDDQTISTDGTAGNLSIEDGNTIALNVDDADADPTNEYNTGISFDGANLTVTDAGGNQSVDISGVSTDDQNLNLAANTLSIEDGNSVDLSPYLDNTDDQNISGSGLSGTDLTIGIENGTSEVVDLSSLVGTDDQTISTDGTAGNLSIEDGNTIALNVDDADADPTNEYNTGAAMNAGAYELSDAGGTLSTSLISADANNDIAAGSDGALYLNVASVTIAETVTNLSDNGDGTFTYVNENGISQTISKSDITNNGDGTYSFDNNDGSPVTIDTRAASNPYNNTASGLTASDVQAAIDEVAAGSTDDQTISTDGTAGNLSIEDGNTLALNVDDADADPTNEYNTGISFDGANLTVTDAGGNQSVDISGVSTDDQNLNLAANTLSIEDGNSVDLSPYLDNTDDQNISGSGLSGTDLTIGIENGASEVVDLSSLVGTDDQTISTDGTAGNLSIEDGNTIALNVDDADADPTNEYNTGISFDGANLTVTDAGGNQSVDISGVSTDDQNLNLAANTLSIEDGNSVDLSPYLDNTDDQNISGSGLSGTDLTIGIENGASEVVDLSSLVGTDDQTISTDGTAGNLSIEDGNTIALNVDDADADPTNEYNTGISFDGANLTVTDAGGNQSVDISGVSTDDQNLNLAANTLSIEDGNSVDLSPYLDNTDDQNINTDGTAGNLSIEDGNTIALNVDDADADPTNETNTSAGLNAGAYEITDSAGTLSTSLISSDANNDISAGSDGALYLNVASVTISETITNLSDNGDGSFTYVNENGVSQTVNKSDITDNGNGTYTFTNNDGSDVILDTRASSNPYDNSSSGLAATEIQSAIDELAAGSTDDQNISGSGLSGTDLTIGIENGASEVVDLSSLVGTDDQNLNLAANTLSIEDGNSVDLSPYLDNTDDQNISGSGLSGTDLTIGIENGASEVVDLSSLVGTDDQTISTDGTAGNLSIEDGNTIALNVDDADADPPTNTTPASALTGRT